MSDIEAILKNIVIGTILVPDRSTETLSAGSAYICQIDTTGEGYLYLYRGGIRAYVKDLTSRDKASLHTLPDLVSYVPEA